MAAVYFLNGFKIELQSSTFKAYVADMPDNSGLRSLREQLKDSWFIYWQEGKVFGIPKEVAPPAFGEATVLQCHEHLQLLRARVENLCPQILPRTPIQHKPFTILSQNQDFMVSIVNKLREPSPLLSSFKIRPKLSLEAKLIELRPEETFIGLFLKLGTRWEIFSSLSNLQDAGIDLQGLFVIRRTNQTGKRRLVGIIEQIANKTVNLSESFVDEMSSISEDEVWLEGSRASFARCLKTLLGEEYKIFETERLAQESTLLTGTALDKKLDEIGGFFAKHPLISLAPDLEGCIQDRISVMNDDTYTSAISASSVEYCFDPARTKRSEIPWNGISEYGPFSRDSFSKKSPEILVLFPDNVQGAVEKFLRAFRDGISIKKKVIGGGSIYLDETSKYAGGFAKFFGLINPKLTLEKIPLSTTSTYKPPATVYGETIKQFLKSRNQNQYSDAAFVIVPDEYARLPDPENPYLQSKALLLMAGIPVQDVRVSTLRQSDSLLQYTLQNISVALYAKMNGTPWTVDHDLTISDELVIGIGTCELSGSRFESRQRFVGITTVFRGDGNYLLGNLSDECSYQDYPAVLRASTVEILQDIKNRNGWQPGDTIRLIFHAARPLKNVDIAKIAAECVAEVGQEQKIEFAFLTVSQEHSFVVLDKSQRGIEVKGGRKGIYVPKRGTILQVGKYTRLLCTNGPTLLKRVTSPLPAPLLIHLQPQSTYRDLTYLSEQVLKFTGLSWRSMLPASRPVTIYYSELIAELLARLRNIRGWSPATLNLQLRASKWFL
jgi:hypothetical protein